MYTTHLYKDVLYAKYNKGSNVSPDLSYTTKSHLITQKVKGEICIWQH